MARNPMEKKARTSFIIGVLVTVVIMGIVVALLLMQLVKMKEAENERLASLITVYALNCDVKSGDPISAADLTKVTIENSAAPTNAVSLGSITDYTVAKIDLQSGTVITESMITESNETVSSDLRLQEYNMINISSSITTGDYIDVRLRLPSGQDYIVVSKKKVEFPLIDGVESVNTLWIKLTEDESLFMSCAIVETYKLDGALLYTTKYVEPGMQDEATPTYVPSAEVVNLITQNPNVVSEAKTAVYNRYNENNASVRTNINAALSGVTQSEAQTKVSTGTTTEVTSAQQQRQSYLDSLAATD